jgi:hypothetical protein
MENVIFKTALLRGPKGDRGETGAPDSVPKDGVIAYDGDDLPEGYVEIEELDVYGDLMNEMASLDARLDIVESLPEGSTTMDAELVDIRYGANGKTYQTAGKAVRGQIDEVNENMEWYQEKDKTLIDNATLTGQASGEVASFDMGGDAPLKECVIQIEPKQDLHGYDFPWVGGAGKNKVDYLSCVGIGARDGTDSVYASGTTSISGDNLSINYGYGNNGGILKGIKGISVNSGEYVTISFDVVSLTGSSVFAVGIGDYNGGGTNNVKDNISPSNNKVFVTLDAKSNYSKLGVFIQPTDANSSAVIKNVQVELGQTATSYAPYSNICPIGGYYQAEVDDVGVNLANNPLLGNISAYTPNGDGYLKTTLPLQTGDYSAKFYGVITTGYAKVINRTQLTDYFLVLNGVIQDPVNFHVNDGDLVELHVAGNDQAGIDNYFGNANLMINKGNAILPYEPYNGKTTPVPFSNKNLLPSHLKFDSFDIWSGAQALKEINPSDSNKHWFGDEYVMGGCYIVIETEEDKDTIKEIRISRSEADPGNNLTFYLYNAGAGQYEFDQAVDLTVGAETDTSLFVDVVTYDGETRHDALSHQGAVVPLPDNNMQQASIVINGSWSGEITLKPMISPRSDTDKTFMPYYNGLQFSGERVYKGYVDPVNMKLTVAGAMEIFDGSNDEGWVGRNNDKSRSTSKLQGTIKNASSDGVAVDFIKSNMFTKSTADDAWIGSPNTIGVGSDGLIYMSTGETMSISDWTTYLASNNLQVCYELAVPVTYGINYTELKSLLGVNNISADTGQIAVTFRKDANLVINSLIARIEALEGGNA